jgi:hypothetical protein
MRSRRIYGALGASLMFLAFAGVVPGCGSGGEQIPLAKVPPPPPGFGEPSKNSTKVPQTASPVDANDRRR